MSIHDFKRDDGISESAVKPLHDNTRMLIGALKDRPIGAVIYKTELSRFLGIDVTKAPGDGGGSSYLTGAIRQLETKFGIIYRPLARADMLRHGLGPAIVRLDTLGKQKWASKRARSASKIAHNAQRVLNTVEDHEYAALSPNERHELDATRVVLKLHKHIGAATTRARIEDGVRERNAQLSINQTLQVLLLPDSEAAMKKTEERLRRARERRGD